MRHTRYDNVYMDIIHVRLDPQTRDQLDRLVASYQAETVGTVTQSDIVRYAIEQLANSTTQRNAS